jgi:mono/diheme cytochrome c family protein
MKMTTSALVGAAIALPLTGLLLAAKSPQETKQARVARGKYLVTVAGCNDCHTPIKMGPKGPEPDLTRYLSGHPSEANFPPPPKLAAGPWFAVVGSFTAWSGPWGISYSANLTPDQNTGLGIWTQDVFIKAMRTGKHFGVAREILPPMPWQSLAAMTDEDLKAVYAYLRTIPPVNNRVPEPVPPGGQVNFE